MRALISSESTRPGRYGSFGWSKRYLLTPFGSVSYHPSHDGTKRLRKAPAEPPPSGASDQRGAVTERSRVARRGERQDDPHGRVGLDPVAAHPVRHRRGLRCEAAGPVAARTAKGGGMTSYRPAFYLRVQKGLTITDVA